MYNWSMYEQKHLSRGGSRREQEATRLRRNLLMKTDDTLSYQEIVIDGVSQNVAIINTDNLDTKKIIAMPGEQVTHGSLVEWMKNIWLVTEKDANNEIYDLGVMQQCNYLLRWVDADSKQVMERWCVIEDGTKYLTGEYGDRDFIVTRGDSRIAMTITKDKYSLKFDRNSRFIIDDYGSPSPLAYRLTKPYKLGGRYSENGVLRFVLTECNTEDDDNLELHIADYYTHFPRTDESGSVILQPEVIAPGTTKEDGKKVWI